MSHRFIFGRSMFQFPVRNLAHLSDALMAIFSTHWIQRSCRTRKIWREAGKGWGRNEVLKILITIHMTKKSHYFKENWVYCRDKPVLNRTWHSGNRSLEWKFNSPVDLKSWWSILQVPVISESVLKRKKFRSIWCLYRQVLLYMWKWACFSAKFCGSSVQFFSLSL
jgi:hypothetical protein